MKRNLHGMILGVLCLAGSVIHAQTMIGIGSRYDNSFREWKITTDDEEVRGELRMRWIIRDDWTVWDIDFGNQHATIEQKWADDPNLWVIRCDGFTVNARTAWPNDFTRWKLTDGTHQFNFFTRYPNNREEWLTDESRDGFFQVYTYWDGDPREWVVKDELADDVSLALRLGMAFLALHFSTPHY